MASSRLLPLTFDDLAQRLVRDLANLIHSGCVTERRLAGLVGISQPHLHNVINGVRRLTPDVGDQLLDHLNWSLLDLVDSVEAKSLLDRRRALLAHGREIPLFRFAVGPGFSLPGVQCSDIAVPNSWLARAENPFAASAGEDPLMKSVVRRGDILLLDRSPNTATHIREDALYVVNFGGESLARWVRFSSRGYYLISHSDWTEPSRWIRVVLPESRRAELIEARIIALARQLDGTFRPPAEPSASN